LQTTIICLALFDNNLGLEWPGTCTASQPRFTQTAVGTIGFVFVFFEEVVEATTHS
jgi:hypothetical protein